MSVLRYAAAAFSLIVTLFASAVWALLLPASVPAALAFFLTGLAGFAAALLANGLLSRRGDRKGAHGVSAARKTVRATLFVCRLYSLLLLLFGFLLDLGVTGLFVALLAPAVSDRVPLLILSLLLALAVYLLAMFLPVMTLVKAPPAEEADGTARIPRAETPLLYSLADRAAVAAGYHGAFHLARVFGPETAFRAAEERDGLSVGVPVAVLPLFTAEEVYALLVHVFARAVHRDGALARRFRRALARYDCRTDKLATFKKPLFSYADSRLQEAWARYAAETAARTVRDADAAAARNADPQAWIDACAKQLAAADVLRSPCRAVDYEMFADETPVPDYYTRIAACLDEAIRREEAHLRPILLRTLGASDAEPSLRERMEQADVSDFDLVRRERDGGFSKEMSEETARCDAIARESFEGGVWQTLRETHKLFYDRVIERYERAQKAGTADEYLYTQALRAYFIVDAKKVFGVAERALADQTMRTEAECVSAMLLCRRDHDAAADALMHVLQENPLYAERLLPLLREAVLRTGDEDAVMRERAVRERAMEETAAYQKDLRAVNITEQTVLACDLTQARLAHIGAVLLRLGSGRAFLVRADTLCERAVYAVIADENDVDGTTRALLADYLASISLPAESYLLKTCPAGSPVMQAAQKTGIRLA